MDQQQQAVLASDALFTAAVADLDAATPDAAPTSDADAAANALFASAVSDLRDSTVTTIITTPAFLTNAPPLAPFPPSLSSPAVDALLAANDDAVMVANDQASANAEASVAALSPRVQYSPAFSVVATFGTVPDVDSPAAAPTYRGADLAVDGDAVYLGLQDGGKNWRASVYRVDGAAPRAVGGSPGFTPGPAIDVVLAAAAGTLAIAYREGVYHHGYYRDGDDSWVYVAKGGARFGQVGAPFTNARPRDLALALDPTSLTPVVAFADDEYGRRATVRALARDGGWPTVGDQGFSTAAVSGVKLALDPASPASMYVAYNDAACGDRVTVKRFAANTWTTVGAACFSTDKAAGLALAIVPNGNATSPSTPCVSYGDSGLGVVTCFVGGAWRTIGGAPFSNARTAATSLAFDRTRGALIVAYRDSGYGGRASVSRVDAGGWSSIGPRGFTNDAVWRTRLAVTARGSVYVATEIGGGVDQTDGVIVYKMK